jgi:hypothetical protein
LILKFSVAKGHVQVIGTPKKVADLMEQWFVERGADGFNVVPPLLPGGFEDFVRLVVPLLQRRGLVRQEYDGDSFRENLRLKRPANPHTVGVHRSAATAASIDREDAAVAGDANVASAAGGRR